jgi:hypothetical protein
MQETSQRKKREEQSSALPEGLVHLLGQNEVLQRLIRERLPLTADNYIALNWWGEMPEEFDEDDLHVINLLRQHEADQNTAFGAVVARGREMGSNDRDAGKT